MDQQNNLLKNYEQLKYDSLGRYYHIVKGRGTCVLGANLRYEGVMGPNYQLTGKGQLVIVSPRKVIYGEFKDGKITYGIIETEKYKYEGEIKDELPNGKGKMVFHDKDWGEGEFKDGIQVGSGRFYSNCCESLFEGEFKDGHKSGKGTETFQNGDKYQGEFKEGQFSGKGAMHFANGDIYEGQFDKGVYHGHGKLVTKEATIESEWTHGKLGDRNEDHVRFCCAGHQSPTNRKVKAK